MSDQLRIALFGVGKMGMHHVRAIELQENARLVAAADPSMGASGIGEKLEPSVEKFKDPKALLAHVKPDVVHIVTPPGTHVDLATMALEAGAHVYVEKPFSLSSKGAEEVISVARQRGLSVCPAHQVLFQDTGTKYRKYLPLVKEVVQVESYFSFKPVRRSPDGAGAITPIDQLLDILPHPVYLMLSAFENDGEAADTPLELKSVEVDAVGEVHAIFKQGKKTGILIVSLRGRPIESYLKINGTNGQIVADFILTGAQKYIGPGASAISLVYKPFSQALQVTFGTIATVFWMIFKRQKSYAGLAQLVEQFYQSILSGAPVPVPSESLLETVRICEEIGKQLKVAEEAQEAKDLRRLSEEESKIDPTDPGRGIVLVTGGTGFLGKEVIGELRSHGWPVRVVARKLPPAAVRKAGVEYVEGDISEPLPDSVFSGVLAIAHLAAETIGGKEAHERNTIQATRNMLAGAKKHSIRKFINISSIAVLKPSSQVGGPLDEKSPVDANNLGRGPYVWGKAEAELSVNNAASSEDIDARTIRLGPLVDFEDFTPPGRLGREVGPFYVVMGNPWSKISVCDVRTASNVIRYYVEHFDESPKVLNLVEAEEKTRSQLAKLNKKNRPELVNIWLLKPFLYLISASLKVVFKLLRPKQKALNLYSAFASERYDTTLAREVIGLACANAGYSHKSEQQDGLDE